MSFVIEGLKFDAMNAELKQQILDKVVSVLEDTINVDTDVFDHTNHIDLKQRGTLARGTGTSGRPDDDDDEDEDDDDDDNAAPAANDHDEDDDEDGRQ